MRFITPMEELARNEGIEQGIEQGIHEEKVRNLRKLLSLRFGNLAQDAVAKLESAANDTLDAWFERAVTIKQLKELWQ